MAALPVTGESRHPLRFGVNYTPSGRWFHSWLDLDLSEVRRDLADIAELGVDHFRLFPLWPLIQPNRGLLRTSAIADVLAVIDAAAEFGLDVSVDLLQGHLSSFDFVPTWLTTWHQASVFTDLRARAGITHYAGALTEAVTDRDNVFAVTIGNEVNNLWPANPAEPEAVRVWVADLVEVITSAARGRLVCYSAFDDAWYSPGHPFQPREVVSAGDLSTVHSWVFNGTSRIDGPLGPATLSHAEYLIELAVAGAEDPDRKVWLQEIGVPEPDVPAEHAAEFVTRTLAPLVGNPALYGVTWWSSHDIDHSLLDFPAREYSLGLFDVDHRIKPAGRSFAEIVRTAKTQAPQQHSQVVDCPVNPVRDPGRRALIAPGSDFHAAWVRSRAAGPTRIRFPAAG